MVTVTADLTNPSNSLKQGFDAILLDAPCSGSGTLGRRPEIRWRLDESAVKNLCTLQGELLKRCAMMVVPGGRLVFVVCSILSEEGMGNADRFLDAHPDFTLTPTPPLGWPFTIPWNCGKVFIDPSETRTDGYQIISMMRRR
jgi:16S rRNA (cytosine967-C5)-methyltransferase